MQNIIIASIPISKAVGLRLLLFDYNKFYVFEKVSWNSLDLICLAWDSRLSDYSFSYRHRKDFISSTELLNKLLFLLGFFIWKMCIFP